MDTTLFRLVEGPPGHYEIWGDGAEAPCLRLGRVDRETAENVYCSIELAWQRNEEWRAGEIWPVPVRD